MLGLSHSIEDAFVAAFQSFLPTGAQRHPAIEGLRPRLLSLWHQAQRAYQDVTVAPAEFAEALALSIDLDDPERWVSRVRGPDLYLAWAAGRRDVTALSIITSTVLPRVVAELCRAGFAPVEAEEACHVVFGDLVSRGPDGRPAILGFRGHCRLVSWMRVSALRAARRMFARRREIPLPDGLLADLGPAGGSPELEYCKRMYAVEVKEAFAGAFAALSTRDRNLLRLYILGDLTPDQLASIYHVHRTTIARQIARARDRLVEDVRERLQRRFSIGETDLESILRLVRSRVDLAMPARG